MKNHIYIYIYTHIKKLFIE